MSLESQLLARFGGAHPSEAARLLAEQSPTEAATVLAALPRAAAAAVLGALAPAPGSASLASLPSDTGAEILERLAPARAAALLRRLEPERRAAILARLPRAERLQPLLEYPEGTAASLMDPELLALPADLELDEARRQLGRFSAHSALELFVVDDEQRLVGVADLRQVLDAGRRGSLGALARPVEPLAPRTDTAAMAVHPGWREHAALPVVDERGLYLGAVRQQRLRQALEETPAARRSRGGLKAMLALGELYWLGLSGLFTGLAPNAARGRRAQAES